MPPFQRCPTATGTPSAPICANPMSLRPIQPDMTWQPIPLAATDPSGILVEVLCGQPEQKNGVRDAPGTCNTGEGVAVSARARSSSPSSGKKRPSRSASTDTSIRGVISPVHGSSGSPAARCLPTILRGFAPGQS